MWVAFRGQNPPWGTHLPGARPVHSCLETGATSPWRCLPSVWWPSREPPPSPLLAYKALSWLCPGREHSCTVLTLCSQQPRATGSFRDNPASELGPRTRGLLTKQVSFSMQIAEVQTQSSRDCWWKLPETCSSIAMGLGSQATSRQAGAPWQDPSSGKIPELHLLLGSGPACSPESPTCSHSRAGLALLGRAFLGRAGVRGPQRQILGLGEPRGSGCSSPPRKWVLGVLRRLHSLRGLPAAPPTASLLHQPWRVCVFTFNNLTL